MTDRVIADATSLIAFERIDRLDVLESLFGSIVVPPAVARDIEAKGFLLSWMIEESLLTSIDVRLAESNLDAGEREAIGLALQTSVTRIILDDEPARRLALKYGLPVTGTLGVLILAKQAGIVDSIRSLVEALVAADFRIDAPLRTWALKTAGETD